MVKQSNICKDTIDTTKAIELRFVGSKAITINKTETIIANQFVLQNQGTSIVKVGDIKLDPNQVFTYSVTDPSITYVCEFKIMFEGAGSNLLVIQEFEINLPAFYNYQPK